jgi:putative two-component system response regulator
MAISIAKDLSNRRSIGIEDATKPKLQRLLASMSERRVNAPESSRDFYMRSARWLAGLKSTSHMYLRLECLEMCAKYFYRIADRPTMLTVVREFDRVAHASGNEKWLRKAYSYLGIAYADVGDLHRSLVSYGNALRIARESSDKFDESIVLSNLGVALMTAGLYTDSVRAFERAFEIGIAQPALLGNACVAATNLAQLCFRQGHFEAGIRHVDTALRLESGYPSDQYDLHRVILESNYVQLAIGAGRPQLARQRLELCEEFALKGKSARASLIAQLVRGLFEVEYGNTSAGVTILRTACQTVTPRTDEWIDANLFLIRALEKIGDLEQALQCADAMTAGLSRLVESSAEALIGDSALTGISLRPDELDKLALQRSRLETKVALRQAAQAKWEAVERLAMASELKADKSGLHGHRVGRLSGAFARYLGLNRKAIEQIEVAGRLHDIGKMAIPDQVLHSATKLSPAEREVLKAHTRIGADLLSGSASPELQCAEIVARHHHERWDGAGYPSRLAGKRIPVECRIVTIADAFDAMTHGRPQTRPVSTNIALTEIALEGTKRFDPELCNAFSAFMRALASEHSSIQNYLEQGMKASPVAAAINELNDLVARVPGLKGAS